MNFKTVQQRLIALTHLRYQAMQNDDVPGKLSNPLAYPHTTTWEEVRQQEAKLQQHIGDGFVLDYDIPRATYILVPRS